MSDLDSIYNTLKRIDTELLELADQLTYAHELNPDFTLIEVAKILSCLMNIKARIYVLRPDLVPDHLKEKNWSNYIPQ